MLQKIKKNINKKLILKFGKINRLAISTTYIKGNGVEIGAMEFPLQVPVNATVKYLDRCSKIESAHIFPEIAKYLVNVDIIDDGETLSTLSKSSQDFIIANHFIEHTQNPFLTIKNFLRVLKPGGIIYMAIPDKRYTFDNLRKNTTLEHLCKDFEEGPDWSEFEHYYNFVKFTEHGIGKTDEEINSKIAELKARYFSIHFHVWDHTTMMEMFLLLKSKYNFLFEIELAVAALYGGNESIFILKKLND